MITVTGGTTVDGGPLCGPGGGHWFAGNEKAVGHQVLNWVVWLGMEYCISDNGIRHLCHR